MNKSKNLKNKIIITNVIRRKMKKQKVTRSDYNWEEVYKSEGC